MEDEAALLEAVPELEATVLFGGVAAAVSADGSAGRVQPDLHLMNRSGSKMSWPGSGSRGFLAGQLRSRVHPYRRHRENLIRWRAW